MGKWWVAAWVPCATVIGLSCGEGGAGPGSTTGGTRNPTCAAGTSAGEVARPTLVTNLDVDTSWYASPVVADLDGDGKNELVTGTYSIAVFDATFAEIAKAEHDDRVYAPHVVADLEGDGVVDIVAGVGSDVVAYELRQGRLEPKAGFPTSTESGGEAPEVRGLAAGDLDGDGNLEIVATTTQTASTEEGGAQVFVFSPDGTSFQPAGAAADPAWPRYNARTGPGNDADRNGMGHDGYGCFGLNVAIGNVDDDADLEVVATYDNHFIQVFDPDGVALDAAPFFTNRQNEYEGERMTWGQFIRWADADVEARHYHEHVGAWPGPVSDEWLQWTASPPNVVDLDGDGKNEVLGLPNVEMHEPYETQAYAVMVLEGAHGDGSRSAMRKAGWEKLPRGGAPIFVDGYYPPLGVPAPATVDLQGDARPEIVVSFQDGTMRALDAGAAELWRFDFLSGKSVMFASEPIIADLNQDGSPEVLFTTYGAPDELDSGHLFVLGADGSLLHDVPLDAKGSENGNGNGAPAAPTVGDLDGDGQLEIFVQTFEHGLDVFTVPGSGTSCLPWPTARGGPLRMGQPNGSS